MVEGKYRLLRHGTFNRAGEFIPTSTYLQGELIYSSEKFLSVLILFNPSITSEKDFLAYTGTYEISSHDQIIHHISLCSQSNRNGTSEARTVTVQGSTIKLGLDLDNGDRFEALWEKV